MALLAPRTGVPACARASGRSRVPSVRVLAQKKNGKGRASSAAGRVALGALAGSALLARPALAELAAEGDAVDTAVNSLTDAVKAAGVGVKAALDLVGAGVKIAKEGYDVAAPVIKQGVDAVAPVVSEAVKVTTETAAPLLQKATPVVTDSLQSAIKGAGVDVDSLQRTTAVAAKTATEAATTAQPFLTKAYTFLTTTEPVLLAEYGLGALALYYLAPVLAGGLFGSLRGYAGEVTAAQALDLVGSDGGAVIIDIRTEREKEASGLADVPGGARGKLLEVEYAFTEDKKLRGQLRDANAIEAQITALQIASLKRVGRGNKVVLLDRFGSTSKAVAKELSRRGFGRVFVVAGGFDGRGGWVQSKLLVKPTASMFGGVSGSPLPAALARTLSTRTESSRGRKALPAPSK
ncbi:Calcium sensing receptor [Scenedesmus sp. PABB004]|nr:Calcium sensing receptor [Scenedesmus sp. PABB004]